MPGYNIGEDEWLGVNLDRTAADTAVWSRDFDAEFERARQEQLEREMQAQAAMARDDAFAQQMYRSAQMVEQNRGQAPLEIAPLPQLPPPVFSGGRVEASVAPMNRGGEEAWNTMQNEAPPPLVPEQLGTEDVARLEPYDQPTAVAPPPAPTYQQPQTIGGQSAATWDVAPQPAPMPKPEPAVSELDAIDWDALSQPLPPLPPMPEYSMSRPSGSVTERTAAEFPTRESRAIPGTSGNVPQNAAEFFSRFSPYAEQVAKETGISAAIMMGIAANETGFGRYAQGNNFFGIKGANPNTEATFNSPTWEEENGRRVNTRSNFRAYDNPADSFRDFAQFLRDNPRYRDALTKTSDPVAFIRAVHAAGYATDSNWSNQVLNLASMYDSNASRREPPAAFAGGGASGSMNQPPPGIRVDLGGILNQRTVDPSQSFQNPEDQNFRFGNFVGGDLARAGEQLGSGDVLGALGTTWKSELGLLNEGSNLATNAAQAALGMFATALRGDAALQQVMDRQGPVAAWNAFAGTNGIGDVPGVKGLIENYPQVLLGLGAKAAGSANVAENVVGQIARAADVVTSGPFAPMVARGYAQAGPAASRIGQNLLESKARGSVGIPGGDWAPNLDELRRFAADHGLTVNTSDAGITLNVQTGRNRKIISGAEQDQILDWAAERGGRPSSTGGRQGSIAFWENPSSRSPGPQPPPAPSTAWPEDLPQHTMGNPSHWSEPGREQMAQVVRANPEMLNRPEKHISDWRRLAEDLNADPDAFLEDLNRGAISPQHWFALHNEMTDLTSRRAALMAGPDSADKAAKIDELDSQYMFLYQKVIDAQNTSGSAMRAMRETAGEPDVLKRQLRAGQWRQKADDGEIAVNQLDEAVAELEDIIRPRLESAKTPEEIAGVRRDIERVAAGVGGGRNAGRFASGADDAGVRIGDGGIGGGGRGAAGATLPPDAAGPGGVGRGGSGGERTYIGGEPPETLNLGEMTAQTQAQVQREEQWNPMRTANQMRAALNSAINATERDVVDSLRPWVREALTNRPAGPRPDEPAALTRAIDRIARGQSPDAEREIADWLFTDARLVTVQAREAMREAVEQMGDAASPEMIRGAAREIMDEYAPQIRDAFQRNMDMAAGRWGYAAESTGRKALHDLEANLTNAINNFGERAIRATGNVANDLPTAALTNRQMMQNVDKELKRQYDATLKEIEQRAKDQYRIAETARRNAEKLELEKNNRTFARDVAAGRLIEKAKIEKGAAIYLDRAGKPRTGTKPTIDEIKGLQDYLDKGDNRGARGYLEALDIGSPKNWREGGARALAEIMAARVIGMLSRTTTLGTQVLGNTLSVGSRPLQYAHQAGVESALDRLMPRPSGVGRTVTGNSAVGYVRGLWGAGVEANFGYRGKQFPSVVMRQYEDTQGIVETPWQEFVRNVQSGKPLFSDAGNVEIPRHSALRQVPGVKNYIRGIESQDAGFRSMDFAGQLESRIELELDRMEITSPSARDNTRAWIESNIAKHTGLWQDVWDKTNKSEINRELDRLGFKDPAMRKEKGAELAAIEKRMLTIINEAGLEAQDTVFQRNNAFTTMLLQMKANDPTSISRWIIPFTQVPTNIAGKSLELMPGTSFVNVGIKLVQYQKAADQLATAVLNGTDAKAIEMAAAKATYERGRLGHSIASSVEGLELAFLYSKMVDAGWITGDERPDGNEDPGWKPGSVFINGSYIPVQGILGPLAAPAKLMANIKTLADRRKGEFPEMGMQLLGMTLAGMADQTPFVQNMFALGKFLMSTTNGQNSENGIGRGISSFAGSFVPGILTQAGEIGGTAAKAPTSDLDFGNVRNPATEGIAAKLPGVSNWVPDAVDTRGNPRSAGNIGRGDPIIGVPAGLVAKSYASDDTTALREMRRLNIPFRVDRGAQSINKDAEGKPLGKTDQEKTDPLTQAQWLATDKAARQLVDQRLSPWLENRDGNGWPHTGSTSREDKYNQEQIMKAFMNGAENLSRAINAPGSYNNRGKVAFVSKYADAVTPADEELIDFANAVSQAMNKANLPSSAYESLMGFAAPDSPELSEQFRGSQLTYWEGTRRGSSSRRRRFF